MTVHLQCLALAAQRMLAVTLLKGRRLVGLSALLKQLSALSSCWLIPFSVANFLTYHL